MLTARNGSLPQASASDSACARPPPLSLVCVAAMIAFTNQSIPWAGMTPAPLVARARFRKMARYFCRNPLSRAAALSCAESLACTLSDVHCGVADSRGYRLLRSARYLSIWWRTAPARGRV